MMDKKLVTLAEEVEAALVLEPDLTARVREAVAEVLNREVETADLESTDKMLALIHAARPGWGVGIRGTASVPNGHWTCTLRRSFSRDNDEYVGIARGPTLPHALLAALLKVLSFGGR